VAPAKGLSKQPHLYRTTPQDASFSPWTARQSRDSRWRNAAACRLPPRTGGLYQAAEVATPCPRSAATQRAERLPHWAMTTRPSEPLGGRGDASSEPVPTRRFCWRPRFLTCAWGAAGWQPAQAAGQGV